MISPSATNPLLTEQGFDNVFRTCGRDDQQGDLIGEYLSKNYAGKNIAVVQDKTAYGQGLAEEVRPYGVHVCALCPGSTDSEFHAVAGTPQRSFKSQETAEKVARVGLQAVAKGKSYVISGARNYLLAHSQRLSPRSMVTKIAAKMYRPER